MKGVKGVMERLGLKRRKVSSATLQRGFEESLITFCKANGIKVGTPPKEILRKLESIPDLKQRHLAIQNFRVIIAGMKGNK